jgi:hypothetical protein
MAYDHEKPEYDERGQWGIKGTTDDRDTFNIKGDKTKGTINVAQWVWNPSTLEWEKAVGPGAGGDTPIFNDVRVSYLNDRDVEYIGRHETSGADESDTTWLIKKVFYDTNYNVTRTQVATGSWTDRENLF